MTPVGTSAKIERHDVPKKKTLQQQILIDLGSKK